MKNKQSGNVKYILAKNVRSSWNSIIHHWISMLLTGICKGTRELRRRLCRYKDGGNSMNHRLFILPFLAIAVCLVSAGVGTADDVDVTYEGHFGGSMDAVVVSGNYAYFSPGARFCCV
jgi:hypothetical protein